MVDCVPSIGCPSRMRLIDVVVGVVAVARRCGSEWMGRLRSTVLGYVMRFTSATGNHTVSILFKTSTLGEIKNNIRT